ncbi:MAG TPA: hypothetical protein PLR99_19145 [Polyangiaceae bacterium]|jgi:hypothetical protein|nr:hypothetical protein [Polyangiaceae bacterium]
MTFPEVSSADRARRAPTRTPSRELALLALGAVLGTSLYSAFAPPTAVPGPERVVVRTVVAPCQRARPREVGSPLQVEWHGSYYPATVLGMTDEGRVRIRYDGYGAEWDEDVTDERIREPGDRAAE